MNKQEAIRRIIEEKFNQLTHQQIKKIKALFKSKKKKKAHSKK